MAGVDATKPSQARVWNYLLGGKDYFLVDKTFADHVIAAYPAIVDIALQTRAYLGRVVEFLAREEGIHQFLDIGAGLPNKDNVHEVAQRVNPRCRVVYVDNDPSALAHARALLTSHPEGMCDYVSADAREPEVILRAAAKTLDLSRPVALMMLGVLGTVQDDNEAEAIVDRLLDALPSGSYFVLEDGTRQVDPQAVSDAERVYDEDGGYEYHPRTTDQLARFFDGLEMLEPGLVSVSRWRLDPDTVFVPPEVDAYGGVGRKP